MNKWNAAWTKVCSILYHGGKPEPEVEHLGLDIVSCVIGSHQLDDPNCFSTDSDN